MSNKRKQNEEKNCKKLKKKNNAEEINSIPTVLGIKRTPQKNWKTLVMTLETHQVVVLSVRTQNECKKFFRNVINIRMNVTIGVIYFQLKLPVKLFLMM